MTECEYEEHGICLHPRMSFLKRCPIFKNEDAYCSLFKKKLEFEDSVVVSNDEN